MRAFLLIATVVLLATATLVGIILWHLASPGANRMEAFAATRIHRLCGWQPVCKVQLKDLFEGRFDVLYAFNPGVSQSEIDSLVEPGRVRARESQRVLVLTRQHRILDTEHADFGIGKPLDNQVEFLDEDRGLQRIAAYPGNTWFRVTLFPTPTGGTFYVLTPTTN